jgi:hypothetical protein
MGLGQRDQALDTLEHMVKANVGAGVRGTAQWHAFDQLRSDSRFKKLLLGD